MRVAVDFNFPKPNGSQKKNITDYKLVSKMFLKNITNYKDWKCAVSENPSVRIESAGSKTSDNRPLKNGSAVLNCLIVCW